MTLQPPKPHRPRCLSTHTAFVRRRSRPSISHQGPFVTAIHLRSPQKPGSRTLCSSLICSQLRDRGGGGKVGCWRLCEAGGWGGDRRWWFTVLKNVRHMLEKCARGFNSSGPAGGRSWESWRAKEGAGKRGVVGGGGSFGVRRDALTFRPEHSRAGREPPRNLTVLSSKPQRAESFSTPASSLARSVPHSLLRSLARRRERSDPQSASIVTSAS